MKSFVITFAILFSFVTFAQKDVPNLLKNGGLERDASKVDCNDELQECRYLIVNTELDKLSVLLQTQVFQGNIVTASNEGYLSVEDSNTLIWGVSDKGEKGKARYERLKVLVPSLDHFIIPAKKPWIKVQVKIYAITQAALSGFEIGLKSISFGGPKDGSKQVGFTAENPTDVVDMNLNLGLVQAKAVMRWGRSNSSIEQIDQIERFVPIYGNISYEDLKHFEIAAPTVSQSKELRTGIEFSGKVSILHGEDSLVLIDGFGLEYSTGTGDLKTTGVQRLSFGGTLVLPPNTETAVITANKALVAIDKSGGLFGLKHSRSTEERHLMISFRAIPMSFDDMIDSINRDDPKLSAIGFMKQELAKLPDAASTKKALENLEPYASTLSNGDVILGFHVDPDQVSKANLNNLINIEIKGLKQEIKDTRSLQSLAVGQGYRILKPLATKLFAGGVVKFKISVEDPKEGHKVEVPVVFQPYEGKVYRE